MIFTDGEGAFVFKKDKDLAWVLMVDYAANEIQYRIEASGYQPFETNLYGGGSFYPGSLLHDIGGVLLHRASHEVDRSETNPMKLSPRSRR